MYTDGFGAALIVGAVVLLLPTLWFAWWFVADLGNGGRPSRPTTV